MGDIVRAYPVRSTPRERARRLRMLWDNGSPWTFVKASVAEPMRDKMALSAPHVHHGLGDGAFRAHGVVSLYIRLLGIWCRHDAEIVPDEVLERHYDILIGHDFMQRYDIRLRPKREELVMDRYGLLKGMRVRSFRGHYRPPASRSYVSHQ